MPKPFRANSIRHFDAVQTAAEVLADETDAIVATTGASPTRQDGTEADGPDDVRIDASLFTLRAISSEPALLDVAPARREYPNARDGAAACAACPSASARGGECASGSAVTPQCAHEYDGAIDELQRLRDSLDARIMVGPFSFYTHYLVVPISSLRGAYARKLDVCVQVLKQRREQCLDRARD